MIKLSSESSVADNFGLADAVDPNEGQTPSDMGQAEGEPGQATSSGSAWQGLGGTFELHSAVRSFAYAGPGGSGGGGAPALPETVTQAEVLKEMKGGFVDTKNLGDPLKKALADAGIDPSELTKIADKQGRVSPEKLFKFIDKYDSNGKPGSFQAYTTDAAGTQTPTKAGTLYQALKEEVTAHREVAKAGLDAKAFGKLAEGHGVLDMNFLASDVKKAFGAAVSEADLKAIAGADGQIKGSKEFTALHGLLDKADGRTDGIASGKLMKADGTVGASPSAAMLDAIQKDVAANRTLPQYAQPGVAKAAVQAPLTIAANAMKVDVADQKPVELKMKGVDQFSLYPGDKDKGGQGLLRGGGESLHRAQHQELRRGRAQAGRAR